MLTKIFLHIDFEDLDVFILIKPFVDIKVEVAAVTHSLALYDFQVIGTSFGRQLHHIVS